MTCFAPTLAGLPGGWEWLIVLFIILLLFGRRLPGVARSLGQGISSFKKGLSEPVEEKKKVEAEASSPPAEKDGESTGD
jgi:sec-independent protein translocase protein TatA